MSTALQLVAYFALLAAAWHWGGVLGERRRASEVRDVTGVGPTTANCACGRLGLPDVVVRVDLRTGRYVWEAHTLTGCYPVEAAAA